MLAPHDPHRFHHQHLPNVEVEIENFEEVGPERALCFIWSSPKRRCRQKLPECEEVENVDFEFEVEVL